MELLPESSVVRCLKAKLPPGTVIGKDAKASAVKAASVFLDRKSVV